MNNFFWTLLAMSILCLFTACGDDENDEVSVDECTTSEVSGTIDGDTFNFGSGRARLESSGSLDIRLFDSRETFTDPCMASDEFVNLFGTLPSAEVGRIDLFLNVTAGEGQTLTFFNPEDFNNIIATNGFIELTAVNETTIDGILNIDDGLGNPVDFLCGSFTLNICQ